MLIKEGYKLKRTAGDTLVVLHMPGPKGPIDHTYTVQVCWLLLRRWARKPVWKVFLWALEEREREKEREKKPYTHNQNQKKKEEVLAHNLNALRTSMI